MVSIGEDDDIDMNDNFIYLIERLEQKYEILDEQQKSIMVIMYKVQEAIEATKYWVGVFTEQIASLEERITTLERRLQ